MMELLIVFSWLVVFFVGLWAGVGVNDFDAYYDRIYYSEFKAALKTMNGLSRRVASRIPEEFQDRGVEDDV